MPPTSCLGGLDVSDRPDQEHASKIEAAVTGVSGVHPMPRGANLTRQPAPRCAVAGHSHLLHSSGKVGEMAAQACAGSSSCLQPRKLAKASLLPRAWPPNRAPPRPGPHPYPLGTPAHPPSTRAAPRLWHEQKAEGGSKGGLKPAREATAQEGAGALDAAPRPPPWPSPLPLPTRQRTASHWQAAEQPLPHAHFTPVPHLCPQNLTLWKEHARDCSHALA